MAAISPTPTGGFTVDYFTLPADAPAPPVPPGGALLVADSREQLELELARYRLGHDEQARRVARRKAQRASRKRNRRS